MREAPAALMAQQAVCILIEDAVSAVAVLVADLHGRNLGES